MKESSELTLKESLSQEDQLKVQEVQEQEIILTEKIGKEQRAQYTRNAILHFLQAIDLLKDEHYFNSHFAYLWHRVNPMCEASEIFTLLGLDGTKVLEKLEESMDGAFGKSITGSYAGPFRPLTEEEKQDFEIKDSRAVTYIKIANAYSKIGIDPSNKLNQAYVACLGNKEVWSMDGLKTQGDAPLEYLQTASLLGQGRAPETEQILKSRISHVKERYSDQPEWARLEAKLHDQWFRDYSAAINALENGDNNLAQDYIDNALTPLLGSKGAIQLETGRNYLEDERNSPSNLSSSEYALRALQEGDGFTHYGKYFYKGFLAIQAIIKEDFNKSFVLINEIPDGEPRTLKPKLWLILAERLHKKGEDAANVYFQLTGSKERFEYLLEIIESLIKNPDTIKFALEFVEYIKKNMDAGAPDQLLSLSKAEARLGLEIKEVDPHMADIVEAKLKSPRSNLLTN